MGISIYRAVSQIYPKIIRDKFKEALQYSNLKKEESRFLGFVIISSLLMSIALGFLIGIIYPIHPLIVIIVCFFLLQFLVYMWLVLLGDRKSRFVDDVLPDALQLMSSNLRAGLTADKAFLLSARPEFGPLKDEINTVGKEIATGKEITEALSGMKKRIRSKNLDRSIELINVGIRSGGELASLLEQTAADLRNQRLIDKKIRTSVNMYKIFIFIASGVAAPILFGLSSYLVEVITTTMSSIQVPAEATMLDLPFAVTKINISSGFIVQFCLVFLVVGAIFASLIIAMITTGKEKEGIKYMPFMILLSISLFFLTRFIIKSMLGGFFAV